MAVLGVLAAWWSQGSWTGYMATGFLQRPMLNCWTFRLQSETGAVALLSHCVRTGRRASPNSRGGKHTEARGTEVLRAVLSIASPRAKPGRQDAAHVCTLAPPLALAPLHAFHLWALRQFSPGSVILTLRAVVGAPPPSFAWGGNSPQY